jgi:hypothetical protein
MQRLIKRFLSEMEQAIGENREDEDEDQPDE